MKVIAINGSPRKNWNTAMLLNQALEGAASQGADTELIHLYEYNYKGCISCFACKLKGGQSYGKCIINDDLKPIFNKIEEADAVILGSPIYFGMTTGEMRSFLERLMFQYLVYDENHSSLFKKKIPVGFIYTMNLNEHDMAERGYEQVLKGTEMAIKRIFGSVKTLFVNDTYQFDNYSRYEASGFNEVEKGKRRKEVFPEDCKKAFEIGAGLTRNSSSI